ncbi:hypothetical protein WME73_36740 [Sorangium sp. So ce302]|uniref:hypothetical protein n=1 Tax=unclassified Sorangium TaxID=2621164 RepID=UPI003F5DFFDF
MPGGQGGTGAPGQGGGGGGAPGGRSARGNAALGGASGGSGGGGGPLIGIAYADDEQLTLDRVTFEVGPGGPGGIADVFDGTRDKANRGSDAFAAEAMRFSR